MLTPRPYQQEAVEAVVNYLLTKQGNPVLDACVSSGKSLMIAEVVKAIHVIDPSAKIIMLTHVKELIEQNFEKLMEQYPTADAGIYSASVGRKQSRNQITYAGIQSVHKKFNQIGHRSIILIDEAHLISPKSETMYRRFIDMMKLINPKVRVIGFTGTAYRTKEGLITEGENALFDDVCHQVTMTQLLKLGFIMPLVSKSSAVQADLSKVKIRGGEYVAKDMQEAMDKDELTKAVLDDVEYWASDRKNGLFFCAGVDHAFHVRDALRLRGYTAETITGTTPKKERERILTEFKAGLTRYITNDSVLTTGTDIPMLDLIVLLRGTKSPVLYTQILGRGVRCYGANAEESRANGKENCLVLDYAGNIQEHGCVDKIEFQPKKEGKKGGIVITPVKVCEKCREPSPIYAKVCDFCLLEFPIIEREIKHDTEAFEGAIMSTDIKPKRVEVNKVTYTRHKKLGGTDSLKVTYFIGFKEVAREWVCLEHSGFAKNKANGWWKRFHEGEDLPTIEEALKVEPYIPQAVWLKKNGKYKEIISYE